MIRSSWCISGSKRPSTAEWGSVVAAPVFSKVFERLVVLTNLPPDDVRMQVVNGQ